LSGVGLRLGLGSGGSGTNIRARHRGYRGRQWAEKVGPETSGAKFFKSVFEVPRGVLASSQFTASSGGVLGSAEADIRSLARYKSELGPGGVECRRNERRVVSWCSA
jgi:hypothetical protein